MVHFVQNCYTAADGLSLLCYTPAVPNILAPVNMQRSKRSRDDAVLLNYTVVMDGAPGPSQSLVLYLKPNPVFIGVAGDSLQYQVLSGGTINIAVSVVCLASLL